MNGGGGAVQAQVAEEVNKRLAKATQDLSDKYASGQGGNDEGEGGGPTGGAYKEKWDKEQKAKQLKKQQKAEAAEEMAAREKENAMMMNDDEDNEGDGDGDGDYELRKIREQRVKELKRLQNEKLENIGKGHGQYREIVQDEFLSAVTSSYRVIVHFYHRDFQRCAIMDMHLQKLAHRHVETKFLKINAEKAPFFVQKLLIRSMPTLVMFFDGLGTDKLIGFEGLSDTMPEGKEDEWPTIILARLLASKGAIDSDKVVDDDGIEAAMKAKLETLRKQGYQGMLASTLLDEEEDDFNLDD